MLILCRGKNEIVMKTQSIVNFKAIVPELPNEFPCLKMLVLFGSRARGEEKANSDWDFAVLYDGEMCQQVSENAFVEFEIVSAIAQLLNLSPDDIDIIDLHRCSPLIAHFVATDGKAIYEKEAGEFQRFKQTALMNQGQLNALRQTLKQKVEANLQRWGV